MDSFLGLTLLASTTAAAGLLAAGACVVPRSHASLRNWLWRAALAAFWLVPGVVLVAHAANVAAYTVEIGAPAAGTTTAPSTDTIQAPPANASRTADDVTTMPPYASPGPAPTGTPLRLAALALPAGMLVWLLGAIWGVVALGRRCVAARRLSRTAIGVASSDVAVDIGEICDRLGLRHAPPLPQTDAIAVPTVVGWLRPIVLLPSGLTDMEHAQRHVITHELAHIRRGDLPVQLVAELTRALLWWHPLAWVVARQLAHSAEQACDDWVVTMTGQRQEYAQTLTAIARELAPAGLIACARSGRPLVSRVRRILTQAGIPAVTLSARARIALASCAVACILAAAAVQFGPAATAHEAMPAASNLSLQVFLATPVEDRDVDVPEGQRLFELGSLRALGSDEPLFTQDDIADVQPDDSDTPAYFQVSLRHEAAQRFADLTAININKAMPIVIDGGLVAMPVIRGRIPGDFSVLAGRMTDEQQQKLCAFRYCDQPSKREYLRGTLHVSARFADGSRPEGGECYLQPRWGLQAERSRDEHGAWVEPNVSGGDGEWVVTHVPIGSWTLKLSGGAFAVASEQFAIGPDDDVAISITLASGATVTGRVVDAETGRPLSARVVHNGRPQTNTDADGWYTLKHVALGQARPVRAYLDGYAPRWLEYLDLTENGTTIAPDIKLIRAGTLTGRVVMPDGRPLAENVTAYVDIRPESELPPGVIHETRATARDDGTFEVPFRAPGSNTLEVTAGPVEGRQGPFWPRWIATVEHVIVKAGETTDVGDITVHPATDDESSPLYDPLAAATIDWVLRLRDHGIAEQARTAERAVWDNEFAEAIGLFQSALAKVDREPEITLFLSTQIMIAHTQANDREAAVRTALRTLPLAQEVATHTDLSPQPMVSLPCQLVAGTRVLWADGIQAGQLEACRQLAERTAAASRDLHAIVQRWAEQHSKSTTGSSLDQLRDWASVSDAIAARASARLGRREEAVRSLRRIAGDASDDTAKGYCFYCLGVTLAEMGANAEAREALEKAIRACEVPISTLVGERRRCPHQFVWLRDDARRLLAEMDSARPAR